jgi:hypothetical protein
MSARALIAEKSCLLSVIRHLTMRLQIVFQAVENYIAMSSHEYVPKKVHEYKEALIETLDYHRVSRPYK